MSSLAPAHTRPRPRVVAVGLAFLLAFLLGLAVAIYGGRRFGWFAPPPAPPQTAQPITAPQRSAAEQPFDVTALTAREADLSSRLAALEARLPVVTADVGGAAAQAGRAEAILTVAAARRALDRGAPLGRLEDQLRLRFGGVDPRAVGTVLTVARTPVTLEDLRLGFAAIAPELQTGGRDGFFPALRRELGTLIVLRRTGTPSPLPAERVARARRLLDAGQVEAALAEVRNLPGAARAENWMAAARRFAAARRALDALEDSAISLPPPGPSVAPVSS